MRRNRPRIGITTSFDEGEQRLRLEYVRAIEGAGGVPIIVPFLEDPGVLDAFVAIIDGLVVTGGPAVTRGLVGTLPADLGALDPLRQQADEALLRAFTSAKRPVLGICYGMQLLNSLDGGTIYADVQAQVEGALVHSAKRGAADHDVILEGGSAIADALQTDSVRVNSRHVQAVASLGPSFRVTGTAPDGVIEAIESTDGVIIGVQFHPERMTEMMPLFRYFVQGISDDFGTTGTRSRTSTLEV